MGQLSRDGVYTVPDQMKDAINKEFYADFCDDALAAETIAKVWNEKHYLCDPHTAASWAVAENYVKETGDNRPMVVLSTASPYKFPAAVLSALGAEAQGDEFDQMEQLQAICGMPIPKNLAQLREKEARHLDVIGKEDMLAFVLKS